MIFEATNLSEQAYEQLRSDIMGGKYKPGTRLSMRTISKEFGISTTPVRDAALRLVREGVLEQPNSRTIALRKLGTAEFYEIQEIRARLEGLAAYHAAINVTQTELQTLKEINDRFINARRNDRSDASAINAEFHITIVAISNLVTIRGILEGMWMLVGPVFLELHNRMPTDSFESTRHKHFLILDALERKSPKAAEEAMAADIQWGTAMVRDFGILFQ